MTEDKDPGRRPTFSERYGYAPFSTAIQIEALDDRTRTDIWNFLIYPRFISAQYPDTTAEIIWVGHLHLPRHLYGFQVYVDKLEAIVRAGEWFQVFDLIEFLALRTPSHKQPEYVEQINAVLGANRVGYRVVSGQVVPITSAEEVAAVTAAVGSPLTHAAAHIKQSLDLFSNRDNPNFAKVIQEAMSAAEAAANVMAGRQSAPLGDALSHMQKHGSPKLHPALIDGWKRIYGFTSDGGGIRHALKDGTVHPDQDLAQYFIITCSAFVNYVAAVVSRQPSELVD